MALDWIWEEKKVEREPRKVTALPRLPPIRHGSLQAISYSEEYVDATKTIQTMREVDPFDLDYILQLGATISVSV